MIIWIASYPKSGNTWIRSLLSTYMYSKDGEFQFNLLKKIQQFPSRQYFEYFINDFTDIKKISNFWIAAQDRINLVNDKIVFLKTHSALCSLENNSFTNKSNTKGIIYVVRDPRNLVTSISHHYSLSVEDSFEFISNKKKMIMNDEWGGKQFGIATILGDWSEHYLSWKRTKIAPMLIIKYEDLLRDTKKTFVKIINFLNTLIDINIEEEKINKVIDSCAFDKLAKKEKNEGFFEAVNSKENKKLNFFYLGKKNNWENLLESKIEKKIREKFRREMDELDYI